MYPPFIHTMHSTLFLLANFQLVVTVLLVTVPFISATSNPLQPPRTGLHFRGPAVQQRDVLPQGWSSLGCYTDNPAQRTLTSAGFTDSTGMTVDFCANICNGRKNIYAGVENGEDCYCGNVLTPGATSASSGDCNSKCVGDTNEICGGTNRLNLYWSGATPQPQPTFVPNVGRWDYVGCFNDSNDARLLTVQTSVNGGQFNNSVESCINACNTAGYPLAGVEFANECWCDNGLKNGGKAREIDTKNCMLACSGSSSEICGGANSLVLYYNGADQPMTTATAGPG